ncbi:MAG: hypothetical protein QM711_01055 [Micropruina sp.]|uniref:hypothetical protein n=1 Tax=Micropruina sp. TaxID=2737536 RepID=UPI0039E57643
MTFITRIPNRPENSCCDASRVCPSDGTAAAELIAEQIGSLARAVYTLAAEQAAAGRAQAEALQQLAAATGAPVTELPLDRIAAALEKLVER